MKHSQESRNLVRQNEKVAQKSQKHDVNLQKNSTLYFQVGLILCLLGSYAGLEMRFEKANDDFSNQKAMDDNELVEYAMTDFEVYVEPEKVETKVQKQATIIKEEFEVVENDHKEAVDVLELVTEAVPPTKKVVIDTSVIDITPPDEPVSILAVQKVPVYPGCEAAKNNDERRKCMSTKLSKHIQRKFDSDLGSELGLARGKHQIYVNFKINKNGVVEVLRTRAPHPRLEKEANRVISKVPKMQPGVNDRKAVDVLYTVPIKFQVQD